MSRIFWAAAVFALVVFSPIAHAQESLSVDLAATYTAERAKIATASCDCFWLQGGSLNGGVTVFRGPGSGGKSYRRACLQCCAGCGRQQTCIHVWSALFA